MKKSWQQIQDDPPGQRFRRQYKRRQSSRKSIFSKVLLVGAGLLIIITGIVLLPAPGPGMLVIFIGLGLISQESFWMAGQMDKLEIKLRLLYEWCKKTWNGTSFFMRSLISVSILLVTVLVMYCAFLLFFS